MKLLESSCETIDNKNYKSLNNGNLNIEKIFIRLYIIKYIIIYQINFYMFSKITDDDLKNLKIYILNYY